MVLFPIMVLLLASGLWPQEMVAAEPADIFVSEDIGSVGAEGTTAYDEALDRFTLLGAGGDIWGNTDAFHFAHQGLDGDGVLTAKITSIQNTDSWAKAGIMFRAGTGASAAHVSLFITPGNGISFQRRYQTGGDMVDTTLRGLNAPYWVKLERRGSQFIASCSSDGTTWTQVGVDTVALPVSVRAGLAVTSHRQGQLCQAIFEQLGSTPVSSSQPVSGGTQEGSAQESPLEAWTSSDIGGPGQTGLSTIQTGTFTLRGSGNDIWDNGDSFYFLSQALPGNGQIIARLASQQNTDRWAKAGLMIRDGLSENARNVALLLTPANGVVMQ